MKNKKKMSKDHKEFGEGEEWGAPKDNKIFKEGSQEYVEDINQYNRGGDNPFEGQSYLLGNCISITESSLQNYLFSISIIVFIMYCCVTVVISYMMTVKIIKDVTLQHLTNPIFVLTIMVNIVVAIIKVLESNKRLWMIAAKVMNLACYFYSVILALLLVNVLCIALQNLVAVLSWKDSVSVAILFWTLISQVVLQILLIISEFYYNVYNSDSDSAREITESIRINNIKSQVLAIFYYFLMTVCISYTEYQFVVEFQTFPQFDIALSIALLLIQYLNILVVFCLFMILFKRKDSSADLLLDDTDDEEKRQERVERIQDYFTQQDCHDSYLNTQSKLYNVFILCKSLILFFIVCMVILQTLRINYRIVVAE